MHLSWFILLFEERYLILVIGLGDGLFCFGLKKDQILVWSLVFGFSQHEQRRIPFHFIMILINGSLHFKCVFPLTWLE